MDILKKIYKNRFNRFNLSLDLCWIEIRIRFNLSQNLKHFYSPILILLITNTLLESVAPVLKSLSRDSELQSKYYIRTNEMPIQSFVIICERKTNFFWTNVREKIRHAFIWHQSSHEFYVSNSHEYRNEVNEVNFLSQH